MSAIRIENLRSVLASEPHPTVSEETVEDTLNTGECERWLVVSTNGTLQEDYEYRFFADSAAAADYIRSEVDEEVPWAPSRVIDLDTGTEYEAVFSVMLRQRTPAAS